MTIMHHHSLEVHLEIFVYISTDRNVALNRAAGPTVPNQNSNSFMPL